MNLDIILIAGDSWAAGECISKSEMQYGGVTEFLCNKGYDVRNLSTPGGSNLQACNTIKNYLTANQTGNIKKIVFWKTEFFREIWFYKSHQLKEELRNGYSVLKDHWVYRPYHQLTEISQRWNIPVYVIGGCSDTVWYDDFEKDFPGVKIICQSVTNYLVNNDHRITDPVFCEFMNGWIDEFLNIVKKCISTNDMKLLISDIEKGQGRLRQFTKHPELFFPDGVHPNRRAQKILFESLIKYF